MERWLLLGLVCAGAGGCRGDRPVFGDISAHPSGTALQDETSPDSGFAAIDTSSTDSKSEATTDKSGGTTATDEATTETSEATTAASDDSSLSSSDASACAEGEIRECGTDLGPCSKGVQTCGEDDKWIAECVGGTEPAASDSCSVKGDDANCDGEPNSHCECVGDETEACNACGQRSCNAETGEWGPCLPVEEPRCNEAETALEVCGESGNWETQECTNPDATNCTAACAKPDGVSACVVSAVDADGDGYMSAACEAAPGDDCDDTTQSVSPGSSEVCDGRDNDCDGYIDVLDSTVGLAGSLASIGEASTGLRSVDIAWHESELFFVAEASGSVGRSVYSGHTAGLGSTAVASEILVGTGDVNYHSARLTSVGSTLGSFVQGAGRAHGGLFFTLDSSGSVLTSTAAPGLYGDITRAGSAFTVVSFTPPNAGGSYNTVYFATGATDGNLGSATVREDIPGDVENPRLAQVGPTAGLVYTDSSKAQPSVELLRWSGDNVFGPTNLSDSARSADIASLASDQFAIAWATASGFKLQVRASNGITVVCSSEDVAFGNGVLDPLDGVAVAESSLGIVVAVADGGTTGQVAAFVLNDECQLSTEEGKALFTTPFTDHQYRHHDPRIAVGGGNIAFAWTREDSGSYRSYLRVMPESMCED